MSKFFINRPIVAIVISILMVLAGVVSMLSLPTAQFPNIADPQIQVAASYTGADANTVSQSVATPIEQQMSGVDAMNYMYSLNSSSGSMSLTVDFNVDTQANTDQILSQMRVLQANSQLPTSVLNQGVTVQQSTSAPLMLIDLSSPNGTYDNVFLANYATINLNDAITRVPGVASVSVFGAGQYAMRCWVNPDTLANLGITVPEIISAIQAQNTVNPAGQIGGEPVPPGQQFTYSVRAPGRLPSAEEFGQIIVRADSNGGILRLRDVARIELGAQSYSVIGRYNGKPAALLAIYQAPGSNAVSTAAAVRKVMEEAKTRFPSGLEYVVALDTTLAVTSGIKEIERTIIEALVLVTIVVFLFLQGWRATLIPLLAVPVSLVGTFMVFPLLGFSINTLSLFGLVLAIGLVGDDAIVVVEGVEHHIEEGMSPREASFAAMEQVASPVIAIALILAAVFIPTAFIPGITGRLYQQFAVTIAISVIFSAFNALTLSPALCALLLKPRKERRGPLGRFFAWFSRVFGRTTNGYVRGSGFLIRKSGFALVFLLLVAVGAVLLGKRIPSSFLPNEDQGYAYASMQLPEAASLERSGDAAAKIEKSLMHVPGVGGVTSVVGVNILNSTQNTYSTVFFITLKDWAERTKPNEQYTAILASVNHTMRDAQEGIGFPFPPPSIPGVGTSGGVTMILEDRSGSNELSLLTQNLNKYLAACKKRPEIAAAVPTYLPDVPQLYVDVDKAKVRQQQVSLSDVYLTMQTFMGGYLVNYFNRFGRQWQTYVEAEGDYRTNIDNIGQFYVRSANGGEVPLSAVTTVRRRTGPEFTMRFNEYEAAQVNISGAPGFSSGQVMAALEQVFKETMPPEMAYDYSGMSFQEQKAAQGVSPVVIFGLSLLFVFLILAAQYESWSLPFSVLLSTPVAVMGAYLALNLRSLENDVFAQIGLVMLIGLSAKNAILIVEFARAEFASGKSIYDAALGAARVRFRPIIMTAFAFILGCVPLWVATGAGGVSRQILGTVVIGGMLAATVIAVFLIPVAFSVVEWISHRLSGSGEVTMSSTHAPEHMAGKD